MRELDLVYVPKKTVGDMSGEVVELGSGVTDFKPGDKVISISFPVIYYPHFRIPFTTALPIDPAATNLPTISGGRMEAG